MKFLYSQVTPSTSNVPFLGSDAGSAGTCATATGEAISAPEEPGREEGVTATSELVSPESSSVEDEVAGTSLFPAHSAGISSSADASPATDVSADDSPADGDVVVAPDSSASMEGAACASVTMDWATVASSRRTTSAKAAVGSIDPISTRDMTALPRQRMPKPRSKLSSLGLLILYSLLSKRGGGQS